MMNETEQLAMQIWLGNLLRLMKDKDYEKVEQELSSALGIIEDDHVPSPSAIQL